MDPDNFYVLFGLADCYRGMNQQYRSVEYWNRILKNDPDNKVILTRAGDAYRNTGDYKTAEEYYNRAMEIELGNPQGPVYYLKRKGDLLAISQDTSTGIGASVNAAPSIDVRLESHQLSVFGNGLKNIKLYQISGSLLRQTEKISGTQASLSLQGIPAGIYLLRIATDKQTFTYPIRIRGAR